MLHITYIFNVDVVETPVNVDDNGDCDSGFRCGNSDNEQGVKMPLELVRVKVFVENHEIYVYRVKHKFDRHQYGDQVAPYQEPVNPDKEHDCCDNQEMNDGNSLYHDDFCYPVNLFSSLR